MTVPTQIFLPGGRPKLPLAPATVVNGLVFVSGQVGTDPQSGELAGLGAREQAKQALDNLAAVLAAAGSSAEYVAKVTVFVTDPAFVGEIDGVYRDFFGEWVPARSAVTVRALPKPEFVVEIEAIASLPTQSSDPDGGSSR
ncbi:MAG: translation initiation inhibitor [Microbacteriaceae bacterium]|jgi:2-iminobutanoate/2-iminopropanoate deaminase|nr:translation initiation inhibitor [Microbacteriaceae bacterium]